VRSRARQGALGGKEGRKEAPPPVEAFLADALTDLGDDSDLSGPMAAALGVEALAPLADVLKARGVAAAARVGGGLRVARAEEREP
jgi:hypothetical protein